MLIISRQYRGDHSARTGPLCLYIVGFIIVSRKHSGAWRIISSSVSASTPVPGRHYQIVTGGNALGIYSPTKSLPGGQYAAGRVLLFLPRIRRIGRIRIWEEIDQKVSVGLGGVPPWAFRHRSLLKTRLGSSPMPQLPVLPCRTF